jgi:hypothetical protein
MITAGQSRKYVNDNVARIKRRFKWGAAQEFVPVAVHQALATVGGLVKGKSAARETAPVGPVALDIFLARQTCEKPRRTSLID